MVQNSEREELLGSLKKLEKEAREGEKSLRVSRHRLRTMIQLVHIGYIGHGGSRSRTSLQGFVVSSEG
jgi:hypothetical protein